MPKLRDFLERNKVTPKQLLRFCQTSQQVPRRNFLFGHGKDQMLSNTRKKYSNKNIHIQILLAFELCATLMSFGQDI